VHCAAAIFQTFFWTPLESNLGNSYQIDPNGPTIIGIAKQLE